ncbi:hypothetical protein PHLGIDRAFT_127294 [Phlebiopsis gigantea 11061_1 CR5-6]|uniref:Deacetylase sirtuin-type domain-containing protein n=1 Tax=Phlebiopsis gigantea (strain 11061_1 CR5-6) TaxID=745531 RepID=A0A0C3RZX8_PHLG1|nr:hypothetical protein PHLGIDRAFT_127294 [Phlebiopsis gigantea 11061_1 CR5-6]
MTVCLPLGAASPPPQTPHFVVPSADPPPHVKRVVKAILRAKRIAVLCGAGISVQAGIPDFRSETGLFQTLKKENNTLSSGRDLFDASVFNSEATIMLFCKMIAKLAQDSKLAQPTPFHRMLRTLDDRGRLLRVYSQNIDALEQKAGLTFGVPEPDVKRYKPRSFKGSPDAPDGQGPVPSSSAVAAVRLPTPPAETPRCIPLHGTVQNMHCQTCLHSFALENYLEELNVGELPICPECSQMEETRQAIGKRSRGVGKLRPSVVLYNELHKDGEEVGEVVQRDLLGNSKGKGRMGADLLLVVGTSLRVPGTKRMVREFSKAIHSRTSASSASQNDSPSSSQAPLSQRSASEDDDAPIKTIYLNLDFPVPTREWEGVFDVWIRGDAQEFAQLVQEEIEREEKAKEAAMERRRRREEMKAEAALAAQAAEEERARVEAQSKAKGKQKENSKKAKVSGKAGHTTLGKRKAGVTSEQRPAKRSKSQPPSTKTKTTRGRAKTGMAFKDKKLTVKFPKSTQRRCCFANAAAVVQLPVFLAALVTFEYPDRITTDATVPWLFVSPLVDVLFEFTVVIALTDATSRGGFTSEGLLADKTQSLPSHS